MSENKKRPLNESIHCSCGVIYISGYTHCPSCGKVNPNDKEEKNDKRTRNN